MSPARVCICPDPYKVLCVTESLLSVEWSFLHCTRAGLYGTSSRLCPRVRFTLHPGRSILARLSEISAKLQESTIETVPWSFDSNGGAVYIGVMESSAKRNLAPPDLSPP